MANIVIKNLTENVELDREAMQTISGGARTRGKQLPIGSTILRQTRVVDYPSGFARRPSVSPKSGSK